jgi:hypothetical protein
MVGHVRQQSCFSLGSWCLGDVGDADRRKLEMHIHIESIWPAFVILTEKHFTPN